MIEGNIMAAIIANHITANIVAAATSPPMGIHIILMVQLPGIGIPPDIE